MAKNLMPEVLKILGVEYYEKFKLRTQDCEVAESDIFCFSEEYGLAKFLHNEIPISANNKIYDILSGYYEIVKLPWEPREGEEYFAPSAYYKSVEKRTWKGSTFGYAIKALNMVYRTKEEAEAHLAEDYEKLTGKKLE